jgi:hypothetical protein
MILFLMGAVFAGVYMYMAAEAAQERAQERAQQVQE